MKIQANNPCCICGSFQSELLFEIKYPQYGYEGTFFVRKCEQCGLLFNSPRLDDDGIRSLYGGNYYFFQRDDAVEFQRIVDIYMRTVALADKETNVRKILEIGSAKGYLLAALRYLGWDVKGIEVSETASEYARKKFGVDSFVGTLEEYAASSGHEEFPLVLAIDLIEHVLNPDAFVACLRQVLADDGILIIDTPNGDSHNIVVKGSEWKGFNPFHIYLFSSDNITRLLKKNGFVVEKVFSYGNCPEDEQSKPEAVSAIPDGKPGMTLKDAVKGVMKKVHLFDPCLKARDVMLSAYASIFKTDLKAASNRIKSCPDYFQTSDSTGPLSAGYKGDNIVIIARKV